MSGNIKLCWVLCAQIVLLNMQHFSDLLIVLACHPEQNEHKHTNLVSNSPLCDINCCLELCCAI